MCLHLMCLEQGLAQRKWLTMFLNIFSHILKSLLRKDVQMSMLLTRFYPNIFCLERTNHMHNFSLVWKLDSGTYQPNFLYFHSLVRNKELNLSETGQGRREMSISSTHAVPGSTRGTGDLCHLMSSLQHPICCWNYVRIQGSGKLCNLLDSKVPPLPSSRTRIWIQVCLISKYFCLLLCVF